MGLSDGVDGFVSTVTRPSRIESRTEALTTLEDIENAIRSELNNEDSQRTRFQLVSKILSKFKKNKGQEISDALVKNPAPATDEAIAAAVVAKLKPRYPQIGLLVGADTVNSVRDKPQGNLSSNYFAIEEMIDFIIFKDTKSHTLPIRAGGGVATDNA